jgi:hypothetical protein
MRWSGAAGRAGHSSKGLVRSTILPESGPLHEPLIKHDKSALVRLCDWPLR